MLEQGAGVDEGEGAGAAGHWIPWFGQLLNAVWGSELMGSTQSHSHMALPSMAKRCTARPSADR